jgi:hypothetical protein
MRARCFNSRDKNYADYGGRGITVSAEWRESFGAFYRDMGAKPSVAHSLDRVDNEQGYSPGNCRWVLHDAQCRNRRSNVLMTHEGRTMVATDWAIKLGIDPGSLRDRLKAGWTLEKALTTPRLR